VKKPRKVRKDKIGKLRVYKMSDEEYFRFTEFCKSIGRIPSEVIRELLQRYYVYGIITILDVKSLDELKGDVKNG